MEFDVAIYIRRTTSEPESLCCPIQTRENDHLNKLFGKHACQYADSLFNRFSSQKVRLDLWTLWTTFCQAEDRDLNCPVTWNRCIECHCIICVVNWNQMVTWNQCSKWTWIIMPMLVARKCRSWWPSWEGFKVDLCIRVARKVWALAFAKMQWGCFHGVFVTRMVQNCFFWAILLNGGQKSLATSRSKHEAEDEWTLGLQRGTSNKKVHKLKGCLFKGPFLI